MVSDSVDKKGNAVDKFNFVTMEDLEKNIQDFHKKEEEDQTISLVPTPEVVNVDKNSFDENHEVFQEANHLNDSAVEEKPHKLSRKLYFSFEARVAAMIILILAFFGGACFLILEALNFGNKETVSYNEVGSASYQVCLTDSEYYGTGCLQEGMEYLSSLVDTIRADLEYKVDFSTDIEYDLAYHVLAITKIADKTDSTKVLYRNEEELVGRTDISNTSNVIQIKENVAVEFARYNKTVLDYKERYAVDSASTLEVILYLDEPTETRAVASLIVPLGDSTFGITKDVTENLNRSVSIESDTWNSYNTWCAIIATCFIIISLILLFKTTRLVLKVTTNRNKYQTALTNILREYDRLIVIARDGYESNVEKKIIKVESFNDILDARDTLEKPIIYSRINDVKSEFIVEDDEKLYKFVLKESDF